MAKMMHLLNSCGMPNLILNIFKVLQDEIDKKGSKNTFKLFQNRAQDNFFSQTKELFKKKRYINLNTFNKGNAIAK